MVRPQPYQGATLPPPQHPTAHTVRIWDLPTRLFHWSLTTCPIALVATAKLGGNAMAWQLRPGHAVRALVAVGEFCVRPLGSGSACSAAGAARPSRPGMAPATARGARSRPGLCCCGCACRWVPVWAALCRPLTRLASGSTMAWTTGCREQNLLLALLGLHLAAIALYVRVRRHALVGPMLHGDKHLDHLLPASRDTAATRLRTAVVLALCTASAWRVHGLGHSAGFQALGAAPPLHWPLVIFLPPAHAGLAAVDRPSISLLTPATDDELAITRQLFQEYGDSLGIDLQFQDFDEELAQLPGDYAAPRGRLLLAYVDGALAGCCALRPLDSADYPNAAEMKRLYVRKAFRGFGLGRHLAEAILDVARQGGYACVLLDTLSDMEAARALYTDLGFEDIPPYYHNPMLGAHYLKVDIA